MDNSWICDKLFGVENGCNAFENKLASKRVMTAINENIVAMEGRIWRILIVIFFQNKTIISSLRKSMTDGVKTKNWIRSKPTTNSSKCMNE